MTNNILSPITYKGILYSSEQLNIMLDWLKDLTFADEVDFDSLSSFQIAQATDRHHEGGITDFDLG